MIGLNLRPAANAMGAVIPEVRADLGLSATAAGVLNGLPGLCFVIFGLTAPAVGSRLGAHRTVVAALVVMVAGQLARVVFPGVVAVFLGSVVALAGMAMGNILLPGLVRIHFPRRVAAVTSLYTTCMLVGAAAASGLTVPIGNGLDGGWRAGVGSWAILACAALIPWIALIVTDRVNAGEQQVHGGPRIRLRALLRNPVAWSMAMFFGTQSMQAYVVTGWLSQILVDAGVDLPAAGSAVAVFVVAGIPVAALMPILARRQSRLPLLVGCLAISYVVGYVGLLMWPAQGLWVWPAFIGAGGGAFALSLLMVTLRARTISGLTALSAFGQSGGYVSATLGPFAFGLLHDLSGGWTVPIMMMIVVALAMIVAGFLIARPQSVEDHLPRGSK